MWTGSEQRSPVHFAERGVWPFGQQRASHELRSVQRTTERMSVLPKSGKRAAETCETSPKSAVSGSTARHQQALLTSRRVQFFRLRGQQAQEALRDRETTTYEDVCSFLDSMQAQELLQQQATVEYRGQGSQKRTGPSRVRNRPTKRLYDEIVNAMLRNALRTGSSKNEELPTIDGKIQSAADSADARLTGEEHLQRESDVQMSCLKYWLEEARHKEERYVHACLRCSNEMDSQRNQRKEATFENPSPSPLHKGRGELRTTTNREPE